MRNKRLGLLGVCLLVLGFCLIRYAAAESDTALDRIAARDTTPLPPAPDVEGHVQLEIERDQANFDDGNRDANAAGYNGAGWACVLAGLCLVAGVFWTDPARRHRRRAG
jgi:hypothetical protein